MKLLTKDAILSVNDLPMERINVPEWGGEVMIRTMTGTDRDAFETHLIGQSGRMENVRARLVALTLCDQDGQRLFNDSEVSALGKKSAKALDRVFAVAQRINGIGADEASSTKKP